MAQLSKIEKGLKCSPWRDAVDEIERIYAILVGGAEEKWVFDKILKTIVETQKGYVFTAPSPT